MKRKVKTIWRRVDESIDNESTVFLGNPVSEGLEEDVLEMPDRVNELEEEIENAWVSLEAHGADVDRIMQLVQNYIELYKIEPERTENMLGA